MRFNIASPEEIKNGKTTDVYFKRTHEILDAKGLSTIRVVMEVTSGPLPEGLPWIVLCGIQDVAELFEGCNVDVYSFPEGSLFYGVDRYGVREPAIVIEGAYGEFGFLETPTLGLICQPTGVATMAARLRKLVGDRMLISFGIRRIHPALCPVVDRAAYLGGFDGVSSLKGAEAIGKEPMGTMPHALIVIFGDQVEAWRAFDEVISKDVPRVALVDTYSDEKTEALMAARALGKRLSAVRLDTHSTRRGDFPAIIREVRWELDLNGFKHVKIIVSGGINDGNISGLVEAGADGFGVGTSLSFPPIVDFAMDIVECGTRKNVAKRGKLSGRKNVWRCPKCLKDIVAPYEHPPLKCPACRREMESMLKPLVQGGRILEHEDVDKIRTRVLNQLKKLPSLNPPHR